MTGYRETLASISYQRFFSRYLRLGGMSGTLQQVVGEIRHVYQQQVVQVPTHRPCRRREQGFYLHRRAREKWLGVLQAVESRAATGQPVLVGSGSVGESEKFAQVLTRRGYTPQVLNAMQDHAEAQVISSAGQRGQITIATNMAGRGTDIALGPGVAELGGLHVIITECHEEYRVDRQLIGRCSRQGDPGSFETHVSLNDPLMKIFYAPWFRRVLGYFFGAWKLVQGRPAKYFVRFAQWGMSRHYRLERRQVMQLDEKLGKILAYTGRQE